MNHSLKYPLRFHPVFRQTIWGGRRLETVLNKPIGKGDDFAESWEVVDHGDDQSVVSHGDLAGQTLNSLVRQFKTDLFGPKPPATDQFPLLLKLLDCNRDLSIQVHPNDDQARQLVPPDLGKTEAWYIIDREPESCLYLGLRSECTSEHFRAAIEAGTLEQWLNKLYPSPGDAVLIPAGTVHALGKGLLVAEIQQSSDTTYRLFDWNRVGSDGKPRPIHVQEGLAVIEWQAAPQLIRLDDGQRLSCDKFILQKRLIRGAAKLELEQSFRIVLVVEGELQLAGDPAGPLRSGQSALLPSCLHSVEVNADEAMILEMF